MYSNTIYILNNTIIECFDIAFDETNKKNPSCCLISCYKRGANSHLSQKGQLRGNRLVTNKRAILLVTSDNRIKASRGQIPKTKKIKRRGDNIVISQSLPER